ncbi:hypothetical protein [Candidatus Methylacidithermus pantelleriae]|uniref:Uncharacterized protein n=1 Tax=Candidatus Methylacidithermus pantelleriae TaxID=2744239 RepID=A0A8J2FS42_9BACT|nr:hypothetical protein [Candidatus Methylacidithermus pantelleriae]CAF0696080.1 conserved hypothetical protein [Candidatus Methylacidithermus pantelleriae]
MKLTQLTSAHLQELAKLVEEKEELLKKIQNIDRRIEALGSGPRVTARRGRPRGTRVRMNRPGQLRDKVLSELEQAGPSGLTVRELAEKLGMKLNNLYSWFYSTGRKIAHLKKIEDGKWAYIPKSPAAQPVATHAEKKEESGESPSAK